MAEAQGAAERVQTTALREKVSRLTADLEQAKQDREAAQITMDRQIQFCRDFRRRVTSEVDDIVVHGYLDDLILAKEEEDAAQVAFEAAANKVNAESNDDRARELLVKAERLRAEKDNDHSKVERLKTAISQKLSSLKDQKDQPPLNTGPPRNSG